MNRFSRDGRMIIPLNERKKDQKPDAEKNVRYIVTEAYCPKGCSIVDREHPINGYPGLRMRFSRPGHDGEFVISAIEGDFDKVMLSGELEDGKKDDLFCPHCGAAFRELVSCHCQSDADMVVIGLTPALDFNNAITFCNVTGCSNGTFVRAGEVIRRLRLDSR